MDRRCVLLISQWSALLWNILEDMKEPVCYIPSGICLGLAVTATAAVINRPVCSGRRRDIKKAAAFFLFAAYAAIVLQLAFFSREPGSRKGVDLQLFGTWGNEILPHEYLVENILMFIPFGLLIPFALPWAEKKKNCILWILAIIGAVAAVAGIAYAVYRFFTPDYLEDFEDDFDDDFDDDFFEDEEEEKTEDKEGADA